MKGVTCGFRCAKADAELEFDSHYDFALTYNAEAVPEGGGLDSEQGRKELGPRLSQVRAHAPHVHHGWR